MNLDDIDLQVCEEKDKSIIANLLQFYCYDIMQQSKLANYSFNKKGLFEKISFFDNYWNEDNYFPYLITSTQKSIGFALVHNKTISNKANWKIAELFILSFYRNNNIGRYV